MISKQVPTFLGPVGPAVEVGQMDCNRYARRPCTLQAKKSPVPVGLDALSVRTNQDVGTQDGVSATCCVRRTVCNKNGCVQKESLPSKRIHCKYVIAITGLAEPLTEAFRGASLKPGRITQRPAPVVLIILFAYLNNALSPPRLSIKKRPDAKQMREDRENLFPETPPGACR